MPTLSELAEKYGTDKCRAHGGGTGHSYTEYYEKLFQDMRPCRILEIGINQGASLFMWSDYWPEAEIIGVDNHRGALEDVQSKIGSRKIKLIDCDCSDEYALEGLAEDILFEYVDLDIIIDDGSHEPEHQILAANILGQVLNRSGIYVIEDVRHGEKTRIQRGLIFPSEVIELDIDRKPDDRLILLRA